jgi:predicted dehydrogenase
VYLLSEEKMRIGVVGLGKMGLLHASLLNVIPNVEVVAVCEKSILMGRLFKRVFANSGVQVVNDFEKFQGLGLDAVYVTTPISSHSFVIKGLMSKGIARSVFVEKTLALDYVQSEELCEVAKKAGGVTMVGYMKRFSVVFGKAKDLISKEALGEPKQFKAYAYSSDFLGVTKESKSSASRGGALSDLGCHVIDLALWMFGQLDVQQISSVVKNEAGFETAISFGVKTSGGLVGEFDISQSMPNYRMPEFGLSIYGSKGKIDVNDDRLIQTLNNNGGQKRLYRHDLKDNVLFSMGEAEYFRENQHFVNSVLNKQKCQSDFDSAANVDLLIEQVRKESSKF